ncbi:LLM class flavin-dependent oxidoreductase [Streptacidiphilus monticola]
MTSDQRIGVMFDRAWAPEQLPGFAREMERIGVDELWVVEDLGWNAGVSAAAAALGATERLRVGIGITPAPLRNAALLAMELATLERIFPGRLVAGVGHGVQGWMESVGARARSPLSLLEETVTAVRALLRGERVELVGREVRIDGLELVHPPAEAPRWSPGWCSRSRWRWPAGSPTAPSSRRGTAPTTSPAPGSSSRASRRSTC